MTNYETFVPAIGYITFILFILFILAVIGTGGVLTVITAGIALVGYNIVTGKQIGRAHV